MLREVHIGSNQPTSVRRIACLLSGFALIALISFRTFYSGEATSSLLLWSDYPYETSDPALEQNDIKAQRYPAIEDAINAGIRAVMSGLKPAQELRHRAYARHPSLEYISEPFDESESSPVIVQSSPVVVGHLGNQAEMIRAPRNVLTLAGSPQPEGGLVPLN
jgi:hypothetical protein